MECLRKINTPCAQRGLIVLRLSICQVLQPFKDIETWQWYVGLGGVVWAMERLLLRTSRAHGMGHYAAS